MGHDGEQAADWKHSRATAASWSLRFARRLCLLTLFALWSRSADAQIVNVLQEANSVGEGASGKLNAGTDWLNGNTENLEIKGAAILRYRSGRHMGLLMAQAKYGEAQRRAFLDQQLAHARYRVLVLGPLHVEAFTQVDRNPFRRRVLRYLLGAGPRLQIFEGPIVFTALGVAYMPEYERLSEGDYPDSGRTRWHQRLSSYLTHMVALGRFNVSTTVYLQPDMGEIENMRAFADLSLEFSLTKTIALALSHSLQLDTEPPSNVRPADSHRAVSVAWTF